jgi:hypothetical protein
VDVAIEDVGITLREANTCLPRESIDVAAPE